MEENQNSERQETQNSDGNYSSNSNHNNDPSSNNKIRDFRDTFIDSRRQLKRNLLWLTKRRKCPYCLAEIVDGNYRLNRGLKVKICGNCSHELPSDFFDQNANVIALIGGPETGKTTFITMLTKALQDNTAISRMLNLHASIVDKNMRTIHQKYVYKIFEKKELFEPTNENSDEASAPFVVRLKQTSGKKSKTMYLSLFDTPGEEFNDLERLMNEHPHIDNADALIFLIDPLNIRKVYEEVVAHDQNRQESRLNFRELDYGEEMMDYEIMETLHEFFRRAGKVSKSGKLKIPVAFCISKADLLEPIASVYIPDEIDNETMEFRDIMEEMKFTSEDIKDFLEDVYPQILNNVEGLFQKHHFFPVAPIGFSPDGEGISDTPTPKGIIYPLLWILQKLKFV